MANYPLTLVGAVPECWTGGQDFAEALANALFVNITIGSVIIGQNEPSAAERDFLWVRLNANGSRDDFYNYWTTGPAGAGWYRKEPYYIGEIKIYENNTAPSARWQFCNGTAGTLNYRSRGVGCTGDGGAGLTNRALGDTTGEETHELTASQNGPHAHLVKIPKDTSTDNTFGVAFTAESGEFSTYATEDSGTGAPHNNMPPMIFIPMYKFIGPIYVLAGVP